MQGRKKVKEINGIMSSNILRSERVTDVQRGTEEAALSAEFKATSELSTGEILTAAAFRDFTYFTKKKKQNEFARKKK